MMKQAKMKPKFNFLSAQVETLKVSPHLSIKESCLVKENKRKRNKNKNMGNKGKRRSQTLSQHRGTAWNFLPSQVETLMSERQKKDKKG